MFGSNFPVDSLYSDYNTLMSAFKTLIPKSSHESIFKKTAREFYAIWFQIFFQIWLKFSHILQALNLPNLIDHVITSKDAGASKPSKKIFDHSLKIMKINTENCVFVGDQIDTDIIGAQNANIKPILIDREDLYPEYKDCVVINNLNELLDVIIL